MLFDIPFVSLSLFVFRGLGQVFSQPIFYAVIFMVYWQCKRLAEQQQALFGCEKLPVWQSVAEFTFIGLLGGFFASMLVMLTGLSINGLGVGYIWPLAFLLMFINIRFLCFAYAGGLVALSSAVFGWPEAAASHVLALVAILHITESALIFAGSRYTAAPVYIDYKGRVTGGFLLNSFWPLPLILTVAVGIPEGELAGVLHMPDWWPLFPVLEEPAPGTVTTLLPITVVAVLGYSSIAMTSSPADKRRFSAAVLFVYSVILLFLSYLSIGSRIGAAVAGMVSIAGHELAIWLDQKREAQGQPIYQGRHDCLVVLSALLDSPAYDAGLKTNDIIVSVNGQRVYAQGDLQMLCDFLPEEFNLEVLRGDRRLFLRVSFKGRKDRETGIIGMPINGRESGLSFGENHSILLNWYRSLKKIRG